MVVGRTLLVGVQASVLLTVVACGNSAETGAPAPSTPTSQARTPVPTPNKTTPTGPVWTQAEIQAIAAAKARYLTARAAIQKAFADPTRLKRASLLKAGNGDPWLITLVAEGMDMERNGWYLSGKLKMSALRPVSVKLRLEQPEVRLTGCLDTSVVVTRFRETRKAVPMIPANGDHHRFSARLVYAPPARGGTKGWYLVEEKSAGDC
jgi:hypothetical protein